MRPKNFHAMRHNQFIGHACFAWRTAQEMQKATSLTPESLRAVDEFYAAAKRLEDTLRAARVNPDGSIKHFKD